MTSDEIEFDELLRALRRKTEQRDEALSDLAKIYAGMREIEDRLNTLLRTGTTAEYIHGFED
ncbi:hypothetical protein [Lichenibacterium dinghuense]|uniref:hypothetical protein n=1 Tax=Lichenibacterium dinghuense TaxID=2895977 RepID=UPI001F299C4E|nr:hypothetical protein [Lichenibacterium sp. 6Y81]